MDKEFTTVSIPTEHFAKEEVSPEVFSQEEEEKVKERLKALGYID
jgi:hypothetical protein